MLSFNLSKPDRVALHKGIVTSHITSRELATMSSTDLANEETKQSILQAEQEALAHSILKKTLMPRAKITHKGLQDIEDVNGEAVREEREHEQEEEERIERERQERLKLQAQRAQAASGSVPPESPVTPHAPSWGAPPPVPSHAHSGDTTMARPPLNPLFVPSTSDFATPAPMEQELNLADLINIDEEPGQEVSISLVEHVSPPVAQNGPMAVEAPTDKPETAASLSPPPLTPSTGLSPFASRASFSEAVPGQSFDLNAVWSAPASKEDMASTAPPDEAEHQDEPMHVDSPDEMKEQSPDEDVTGEKTEDHDFDMFLGGGEEEHAQQPLSTQEVPPPSFENLPQVWHGKVRSIVCL